MNELSKSNYQLAQIILERSMVEKTLLEKALSMCNKQKLHLSQFLVQKNILSTTQIAKLSANRTLQFDKYILIDEFARGGMGVVYRAKSMDLDRVVVLKTLLSNSESKTILLKRFLKEAQAVASLSHPNIVQLYDYGEHKRIPYFTMQYVPGKNFEDFIYENDDLEVSIKILLKVSHALHYAHEQGIVHRDIKPANILLDKNNEPYLADFGLAKIEDKTSSLTQTGKVIGTPFFLSPEQAQGNKKLVTKSTDIYALGIILYQVLTKKYPFTADNLSLLLRKIETETPTPPQKINNQIPKQLNYLCLKAISKKIKNRHSTALEFAEDLQQYLEQPQAVSHRLAVFSAKMWWKNIKTKFAIAICIVTIFITGVTIWQHRSELDINKEQLRDKAYFEIKNLIEQKKYGVALSKINLFLQKDIVPRIIALKAKIYYEQNATAVARKLFTQALSYNKQDKVLLFNASDFYWVIGENKKALQLITQVIKISNDQAKYYRLRAQIYDKLNEVQLSKQDNGTANKIEQADIHKYLQKLKNFKKQQQWGKAIAITEEILLLYPSYADAYKERGKIFYHREDIVSAINDITQAIELQPSFTNYHLQAKWLQKGGYHQDALTSYYTLLNYKKNMEFYEQILQLHCHLGEYDKAVTLYNEIAKINTITPSVILVMAKIYFYRNNFSLAKTFIEQLEEIQDKETLYLRGMIYFRLNLNEVAYHSLQKLLTFENHLSKNRQFDLYRTLAEILMQKGDNNRAKEFLIKSLDIHPTHAPTNFLLGKCYERLNNYKQALSLYTKSIDLEPWQEKFYHRRGNVNFKLEKWLSAHHDFLKCIELGSRSPELVSQLFNTTFNEGQAFNRMLMMSIIFGKILSLYRNTEITLFGEQQQNLAKDILNTPSRNYYIVDSAKKLDIAKQFLQRLDNNSSKNVKTIAANGLNALHYIPEVLNLVRLAVKNNPSSPVLRTIYDKMCNKQLSDAKIVLKKLLITYFTAKDQNSLLQIYNNKQVYTEVLKHLLYQKQENPVIRFYAGEVLVLMCTRNAYEIVRKATLSSDTEVALIATAVFAKYKKPSHRQWNVRELYSLSAFLKIQYIENVAQENIELWLEDPDIYVQLYAIKKMWSIGNVMPLKSLVRLCKNEKPLIRAFALETMWKLQGHTHKFREYVAKKYSYLLVKAMDDTNAKVRQIAVFSAQKISLPECRKKLYEKLHDVEKFVRSQAIIGLALYGEFEIVAKITLNLKEEFAIRLMPFAYFEGATSKTKMPVFTFANTLQRLTKDPDERLRSVAIAYLMKAGGGKVAKFFIPQIDTKDDTNRLAVATGLGSSGNLQMISYLMDIAKNDKNIEIRKAACCSVVRILFQNNDKRLSTFHSYLLTQEKEIRQSASIGYTHDIYEIFYRSQKKASSVTNVFDNSEYKHFLYNIENSTELLPLELRESLEFRLAKAYELAEKDHQAFNSGVIQYLCGKKRQAQQTLMQCNLEGNGLYSYWLARIYFDEQKYAQAQKYITKAAQKYPWDRKIIKLYANIEQKMGNRLVQKELNYRIEIMNETIARLEERTIIPIAFIYRNLLPKKNK
ncbi:protein kinase [Candidatus Uabimicrobium sp. HlEnr_7]|uniref:protein kinase domain-containing protein n=1 Tax=Candidatus Uabimicrobium helgolandensis TaxID=3095367 RepID=UPI0035589E8B